MRYELTEIVGIIGIVIVQVILSYLCKKHKSIRIFIDKVLCSVIGGLLVAFGIIREMSKSIPGTGSIFIVSFTVVFGGMLTWLIGDLISSIVKVFSSK